GRDGLLAVEAEGGLAGRELRLPRGEGLRGTGTGLERDLPGAVGGDDLGGDGRAAGVGDGGDQHVLPGCAAGGRREGGLLRGDRHGRLDGVAGIVLRGAGDGERAGLRVLRRRDVLPHHGGALGAAVRLGQRGGLGQLRGRARRGAHLDRLDGADGEVRRVRLEHTLVLLAGDRHDRAVAGPAAVAVLRELRRGHLLADHLPGGGVGEVVRGHRDVVVRAAVVVRLVGEEVVLVAVHVALVRGEQRGALALGEGAAVAVGLAGADLGA